MIYTYTESTGDRNHGQFSPLVDPYAPEDPNNYFPNFFCDLNSDEYGRPYNGPFDQLVPPNMVFPKFPIPKPNLVTLKKPARKLNALGTTIDQFRDICGNLVMSNECGTKSGNAKPYI